MPSRSPTVDRGLNEYERRIWEMVARSPLESLWTREGLTVGKIAKCTWQSILDDHIFGHAAELGFYFLFSLFPTLVGAEINSEIEAAAVEERITSVPPSRNTIAPAA